jgi:phosphohistidine swiveling domain-containing protein
VDAAIAAADRGDDVILVRNRTSPDDIHGMLVARGIVTETGGATSHAAVVSRELGRPAVVGCGCGVTEALAGKLVTVDGNAGEVRDGILPLSACPRTTRRSCGCWPKSRDGSARYVRMPAATTHGWTVIPRLRCASRWPVGSATWSPRVRF